MHLSILVSVSTFLLPGFEGSAIWYDNSTLNASKEVCMEELGCFSITDDFKSPQRPINVLPFDRATINTRFLLYTKEKDKELHLLIACEKETFDESNFDSNHPVKIIIHGFQESFSSEPWIQKMKEEFFTHGDYNIIIVDWSGGNKDPYYQAAANSRVVGAEIALMVEALEKYKGIKRENVHIISNSLGAQVAGYAGAKLKTLGRITGLAPAGSYFNDMPPSVRLDPSDANFVDIIHTDVAYTGDSGVGIRHNVGHVNFYPNNGRDQPGCKNNMFTPFIKEESREYLLCNHYRATVYFYNSINSRKATPVGFECTEWKDFLDGKCADCGSETEKCAIMGLRAYEYYQNKNSSVQRKLYLKVGPQTPFFLYHYQVNIKLYKPQTLYENVTGTIAVTFSGSKADELAQVQTKPTVLYMGALYQYLVTTETELGEIMNLSLKWYSASLNPKEFTSEPKLHVEYISVIPMNAIEISPRNMTDRVFCGKTGEGIIPGTTANFHRVNACLNFL